MKREIQLKKLEDEIRKCSNCDLSKNCKNPVPGYGNYFAKIVFVGEAPGKEEDLQGLPFVGASGKFLDKFLESINLDREDIYITNLVKCRPPSNRDPNQNEIDQCFKFLKRQIDLICPKIIVTLGRFSMNAFLPEIKISQAHGQVFKIKDFFEKTEIIMPMYHPASALYNPKLRPVLMEDFLKLGELLKKLKK